jgi:FdhD protein
VSAAHPVEIVAMHRYGMSSASDYVAVEEPLEVRLSTVPFATIMRTPGEDRELVAGFLLAERLIEREADIASIHQALDDNGYIEPNALDVWLAGEAATHAAARLRTRRDVTSASACGICGRRTIDDLLTGIRPVTSGLTVSRATIGLLPSRLRTAQNTFDRTGGLHAAGLFACGGTLLASAEDVGRHNAVDKVIGAELLGGALPLADAILFVSGRTSFEIVQKAAVAGIPVIGSVSAPSSLSISLARDSNITLCGFVRDGHFNVYSCAERIT